MTAFNELLSAMIMGRDWTGMGNHDQARELMARVLSLIHISEPTRPY